ncbi:MAG TPA: multicopper oxidase domain-containing protein [Candidatus Thermoplasmatota archaeon]|nr:multicopper oxidase domain-containing protein [Candidatus Thermoplasmatota archaeon]
MRSSTVSDGVTFAVAAVALVALLAVGVASPGLVFDTSPDVGGNAHGAGRPVPDIACPAFATRAGVEARVTTWTVRPGESFEAWAFGATIPGPTLCAQNNASFVLTVINSLPAAFTPRVGGLEPLEGPWPTLAPGERAARTFAIPAEGGVFPYVAVEEEARLAGLYGVIVARAPDVGPIDREYVMVLSEFDSEALAGRFHAALGGHTYPWAPLLTADVGDRVLIHLVNLGFEDHTFHVHGHRWHDPHDGRPIDNKYLKPLGEEGAALVSATSFVIVAAEPGDWMYHCHIYDHINGGMTGVFRVGEGGVHHV